MSMYIAEDSATLQEWLEEKFEEAIEKSTAVKGASEVTESTKESFGDYQCNSALKVAKTIGLKPREVASKIIEAFGEEDLVEKLEIAGPGFINIHLNNEKMADRLFRCFGDLRLGVPFAKTREKVICEFSSPNIAKPMHVGHLRSTIIGESIARLQEFLGHEVIRLNHVGDWGTQFGMLIAFLKKFHPEVIEDASSATLDDLVSWYREAKKVFDEDKAFQTAAREEVVRLQAGGELSLKAWRHICEISRRGFNEIYRLLDAKIDERGESFYNPLLPTIIKDFEAKGLVKIDGGAKCVFLEGFTNKEGEPLPLIIQKQDGGFNYATTDLAGFKYRASEDEAKRIIIVTDSGQSLHFKMVYQAAQKVGYIDSAKIRFDHVTFGLVLAADGKKFRTRSGETERLSELLATAIGRAKELLQGRDVENLEKSAQVLGIGSVKYADLSCNRIKDYTFSYDRMLRFEGNTAAFILYAYVRIQSIKRKIGASMELLHKEAKLSLAHPTERALALHLLRFSEALFAMDQDLMPSRLTDYLFHLAEKFHAFFRDCRVEGDPSEKSRLVLCELTARTIQKGLQLLGIETLERM